MKPATDDGLAPVKLVRGSWLLERAKDAPPRPSTDEERAKLRMPAGRSSNGTSRTRCSRRRRRRRCREDTAAVDFAAAIPWISRTAPQAHLHLARLADARSPRPARRAARQVRRCRGEERSCFRDEDEVAGSCCFPCCPGHPTLVYMLGLAVLCGQQCCERATAFPSGEFMAFYDFASLHQKDPETGGRTGEEKTAFDSALGTMGTWYAHDKATTVALDVFPAGWDSATPSRR